MALTISSVGSGTSTTDNTTLTTAGFTINASVGDVLLLAIAACNSGASGVAAVINSIADNAGGSTNVYTQRGTTGNQTAGAANDGASQFWYECPVTTAITNGAITVTFSANNAQKAIQVYRIQPGAGETVAFQSVGTASAGAARTTHSAATVSVTDTHVIFGMSAIETDDPITGDSDTTNGNWSAVINRLADGGADAVTMTCSSQYKTVNATGNQAYAVTTTSNRDSVSNTIIYAPAADTVDDLLANDVSSASNVTNPVIGQVHALNANDVASASSVGVPVLSQVVALLANDVASASSVTTPTLTEESSDTVDDLLADSVSAASSVSVPTLVHVLAAVTTAGRRSTATSYSYRTLGYLQREKKRELEKIARRANRKVEKALAEEPHEGLLELVRHEVRGAVPEKAVWLTAKMLDSIVLSIVEFQRAQKEREHFLRLELEDEEDIELLLLAA